MLVSGERGKPQYPGKNLDPHMTAGQKIEPAPHWWKSSSLTAAPTLLNKLDCDDNDGKKSTTMT
mgnify:FL=1